MMAEKDAERGSVQKGTAPDSEHHCSRVRTFSASYVVYLFNARQLSITARYIYIYIYRLLILLFLRLTSQPR